MEHLIIDGFNIAFRSHFAFNALHANTGSMSGCVYGFLVSLRTIKKKFPQCHLTVAWDNGSQRRKAIYAEYKATRSSHVSISEQIQDLKAMLKCLDITQVETPGEEADDVIATFVKKNQEGNKIYIYSSDKDFLQLVKDGSVIVIRPKSGLIPERAYDSSVVKNEYSVSPEDLQSYFAFRGDSIDNIPGVPRIKSNSIAYLVTKYKTPEEIYAHLSEEKMTDFQLKSLKESEKQVYLNYILVSLISDLTLNTQEGKLSVEVLQLYLNKYSIKSIHSDSYSVLFEKTDIFNTRTAPAVQSYSLFEEELQK